MLQLCTSEFSPLQSAPPLAGAGFVHVRLLALVPPPQDFEQTLQFNHAAQYPSTKRERIQLFSVLFNHTLSIQVPTYLPTYLPIKLHKHMATFLPTYLAINLPTYLPTYLPTVMLRISARVLINYWSSRVGAYSKVGAHSRVGAY